MATAVKRKLSGSTDGMGIKIAATSTPGTAIHTASSETMDGSYDEIRPYGLCHEEQRNNGHE